MTWEAPGQRNRCRRKQYLIFTPAEPILTPISRQIQPKKFVSWHFKACWSHSSIICVQTKPGSLTYIPLNFLGSEYGGNTVLENTRSNPQNYMA
jgi:hypothetical protein